MNGDTLTYAIAKMNTLTEPSVLKVGASGVVSIAFFLYGGLYADALVAILMLMIIDFILAVTAAKRDGEPITSRRMARTLIKGTVYFSAISAGHFADLTIPGDFIQGSMVAFVGVTEFVSILENVGRHGLETPKKLLNQLNDYKKSR